MKATSTLQSVLDGVGFAATVAVALWARPALAANILFIVNNPPGTASDVQVRDRLTSQGHAVTVIDDNEPNMGNLFADQDLILISSSVGSTAVPLNGLVVNDLRTRNVPVVNYEPALNDEFLLQISADFGNPGGQTALSLTLANESHPLAAGKSGNVIMVNAGTTATFSLSSRPVTIGADAIVIATNATPDSTDTDRLAIWAYEKDSRLADNSTLAPNRRVAFFFNASTSATAYNTDAFDLFDAAVTWALNPGTGPVGIVDQPASQTVLEGLPARLSLAVTGAPPVTYQWFKGTTPLTNSSSCVNGRIVTVSGATAATLTFNHAHPSDSGQYHCLAMNLLNAVTSAEATLTVTGDTTAPRFLFATCGATLNDFTAVLSEPLDDNCGVSGSVSDLFNWQVRNIADPNDDLGVVGVVYTEGSTSLAFTTTFARDPNKAYEISLQGADLHDTAAAQNLLPINSSVILSCVSNELVSLEATWKYVDDDTFDPGPNWFRPDYDDRSPSWRSGPSPFDAKSGGGGAVGADCRDTTLYGLGSVGTCLNLFSTLTPTNRLTNADFRIHFTFTGDPRTAILRLDGKFDDSAQIYLNGSELARYGLPAAPVVINRATYGANYAPAGRTVGDTDAPDTGQFLPPSGVVRGDNVVAVRLVQVNATSSDLTMGLHLYAVTPPVPRLRISQSAGTVSWDPAIGTLRASAGVAAPRPWPEVAGSPTSPFTTPASGPFKAFYVTVP